MTYGELLLGVPTSALHQQWSDYLCLHAGSTKQNGRAVTLRHLKAEGRELKDERWIWTELSHLHVSRAMGWELFPTTQLSGHGGLAAWALLLRCIFCDGICL